MHEYDINELKKERTGLPPRTHNNKKQIYIIQKQTDTSKNSTTHNKQSLTATATNLKDCIIIEDSDDNLDQQTEPSIDRTAVYPLVLAYIDQSPVKNPPISESPTVAANVDRPVISQKRKRPRRVYVAEYSRCVSLRSHQVSRGKPVPIKQQAASPTSPPTQSSSTPTEPEEHKYIKPDQLKPDFWNIIEEKQETRSTSSKRRRGIIGRGRKRRNNLYIGLYTIYSPENAAAIAAAQLELDSTKPAARASRKRSYAMSLYDRRYQTASEDRRVGNGYGSNGMRSATAGTSSTNVDAQDMGHSHQYYGPAGGSNPAGVGSGLNGIVSTLNHAPAMGTLCNIGNTCYLNSVVYTLRFAPHFLHNLHHLIYDLNVVQQTILRQHNTKSASLGRGVSAAQLEHARSWSSKDLATTEQYSNNSSNGNGNGSVNCSNGSTKPNHQLVSEKLHELYHSLHGNEMADSTEPYHADTLLHSIQDVNATFEGNQQQDAHEFLMCVLNCIRETNQSLIKAIGECPEVIANGYIANPDETDSSDAHDRTDASATALGSHTSSGGNGSVPTSHTTKTSFFSRKSKRKDEVKSSKATRLQSPLKDNINPIAGTLAPAHATSNSLFYLNTVDLSGSSVMAQTAAGTAATGTGLPAKYSSDDEMNTAGLLKDKMRLEERIRELNLNFFSTDFEGIVVLTTKCLSCETITRQKQGMLDISVPVPISGYENADLNEKPSAFIQNSCITREYFRGENKYSCNQCTGYTEAIRSISYEVLPRLLVIQLNRFSGGMEKVSTYVPTTFTLACFCAKCCELSDANKLHVYKLYSVITHVGATLTVGHYIAYTCFLDLASDYGNCPKDRRTMSTHQQQSGNENAAPNNGSGSGSSNSSSTPVSVAASALASSGTSLIKKMKFGRSKASSSGDMSKNMKPLNGTTSKTITNGIGKLSMNTTCHGVNCCAMRLCCNSATQQQQQQQQQQSNAASSNSASSSDFSEESLQNGTNSNLSYGGTNNAYPTGYGSTGRGGVKINYSQSTTEPIWYMCDDDKIKAMTQREFEELLSPTRKITITPYLLFYARFDLQPAAAQPTPPKSGTSSTPPPPLPQSSWSSDSLQSGLHKMQ